VSFTGTRFSVSDGQIQKWRYTYPAVDVQQELKLMAEWLNARPKKRYRNWQAFITNWLKKEQRIAVDRKRDALVGRGPEADGKMRPEVLARIQKRRGVTG
jgi:hypothetical protein